MESIFNMKTVSRSILKKIKKEICEEFSYDGYIEVCQIAGTAGIAVQVGSHYRFINVNSLDSQEECYVEHLRSTMREVILEEIISRLC